VRVFVLACLEFCRRLARRIMKTLACLTALVCFSLLSVLAQPSPAAPRLEGIVNLPERKCALLDLKGFGSPSRFTLLSEGERAGDVEVLHINADQENAELRVRETNFVLSLFDGRSASSTGTNIMVLTNAALTSVLELYARCSSRSLLQYPALPNHVVQVRAAPTNQAEAAVVLEQALAAQGITIIPDGEKFALVVPKKAASYVRARSAEIKPSAQAASGAESFPTGAVIFVGADFTTVAMMYAELSGRKTDPANWSRDIPRPNFFFKNQTALTKSELLYAYDTLLEWCGLKMVPDGDEFLKPVQISGK